MVCARIRAQAIQEHPENRMLLYGMIRPAHFPMQKAIPHPKHSAAQIKAANIHAHISVKRTNREEQGL